MEKLWVQNGLFSLKDHPEESWRFINQVSNGNSTQLDQQTIYMS